VTTAERWNAFEDATRQIRALEALDGLANWDQETMMPVRAAEARGTQRGALRAVIHEKLTGAPLGELLDAAGALPQLDARQQALVRIVRRDRDREMRVPVRLVRELAETQARAMDVWKEARTASDFPRFAPWLDRLLKLRREEADARGHSGERYDPLLQGNEPGMTTARLRPILERLRDALVPLVNELTARPAPRTDFLTRDAWDTDAQYAFSLEIMKGLGFDLKAGRLDKSVHPFCQGMGPTDVRLTTRLFRNDGANGFYSALHECGHGLYEQGLPDDGTPLSNGASMGLHESQSRLWENLVGRSQPYWSHWFPKLKEHFAGPLSDVELDDWLRAINRVGRSLIRVDADEVTYNLHILVRFELELALIHGDLAVSDLPAAWNERYDRLVGIRPPDDRRGVLQDIHWSQGEFGYFPTYSVGNMYAASLMKAAERGIPDLWPAIGRGEMQPLRDWLRAHVHHHGRAMDAEDIVRQATGEGLTEKDLLAYLRAKYQV
jgi:carboxypeptidase Taq